MVQGNIPQSVKWDPNAHGANLQNLQPTRAPQGARQNADLIVWPEAAATFLFQPDDRYPADSTEDVSYRNSLLQLARDIGKPILFGAPALVVKDDQVVGFANRAYLVSAKGEVAAWYDKIQLVPFGEYVPFRAVLGIFRQSHRPWHGRHGSRHAADALRCERRKTECIDLLRKHLPRPRAPIGQGRRRRDGEYHQRCVVWHQLGAVSAPRDGGDALGRDQDSDDSGRQHRHQRDHPR